MLDGVIVDRNNLPGCCSNGREISQNIVAIAAASDNVKLLAFQDENFANLIEVIATPRPNLAKSMSGLDQ